jgi:hypothetical protein
MLVSSRGGRSANELDSVGEISGLAISGLRKKLADSTSANFLFYPYKFILKILQCIHTGLL